MTTQAQSPPAEWFRRREGLGVWEGKGKVVASGVGVSPTARRWDFDSQTSIGAWAILAIRRAIDDAGVPPDQVDGLVLTPDTTTGRFDWPQPWPSGRDIPAEMAAAFKPTDDPRNGIANLSVEWLLQNIPELTNVKFTMLAPGDTAHALVVATEAVNRGLSKVCLAVKGWHNFEGRYYVGQGASRGDTIATREKWTTGWGIVGVYPEATRFQRYLWKYGKRKEMFANFVVNSKRNGLNFPEGFFAQHRPEVITREDYLTARWLAKPANLYDADMPIVAAAAFLFTTPERARDMKQKPVYILGHTSTHHAPRSLQHTLEETEAMAASTGRRLLEAAGITVQDYDFENMYDGYGMFHVTHLEGLGGYAGIQKGDALDFFEHEDMTNEGPHPISSSGGNIGSGRTRFWLHVDSMQQIQGRAGARQISRPAQVGVSGAMFPYALHALVWGVSPD